MPGSVNVQVLLGGFFSFGNGGADFFAKNFRAATGERIQSGGFQRAQSVRDGFFCEPGEVKNFDSGEALELQRGIERTQRLEHVGVVAEGQRWMETDRKSVV